MSPTDVTTYRRTGCSFGQLIAIISIAILTIFCSSCSSIGQGLNSRPMITSSLNRMAVTTSTANSTIGRGHISISGDLGLATEGKSYNSVLSVSGGSAPYKFRIRAGRLPTGLWLNQMRGTISGIPATSGTFEFTVVVTDHLRSGVGEKLLRLVVLPSQPGSRATVRVVPDEGAVNSGGKIQFAAVLQNTSNPAVVWSARGGWISNTGLFTAPAVANPNWVTVTATSVADATANASASVLVTPSVGPAALKISNSALAGAQTGVPYTAALIAQGGTVPYTWSLGKGSLPKGLSLDSGSGLISGTTGQSGTATFSVTVSDAAAHIATQPFALHVTTQTAAAANYDGPAELPRVYVQSTMADTPAPGQTTLVNSGGDFQAAVNNANCGDTIQLQAGATFGGQFTLPAKSCDDSHWIVIRSSAADSALPSEGTRITPCFAGVSSLPSRSFSCTSAANTMAKITLSTTHQSGPIIFASGANHYRLLGLEITRPVGGGNVYALASVKHEDAADHIIFDRVWMHGTARDETVRGIDLGGSNYVAVVDSFFTDFHCIAHSGTCTDAQAILGGLGDLPMGPYKIVDNFLEAAGENILFGGGGATATPADIEVRQNHFFKPLIWLSGQPGYVGGSDGNPFIVKNLFELKNAQRVLFEGNVLEYSWGGFTQNGFGILLTPKSPQGSCPACRVTDVTIRYTAISHVAAGLQIANVAADSGAFAQAGERYSIHDLIVDDIDGTSYNGPGVFAEVLSDAPLLRDISLNHITAFAPRFLLWVGAFGPPMPNFSFINSIQHAAGVISTGGGPANCAYQAPPVGVFSKCFNPGTFISNALIGAGANIPPSAWPAGNFFPSDVAAVQFVNYNNGSGGDYHLLPGSPYKNAASDGKDLGADIDALNAAIAGVY